MIIEVTQEDIDFATPSDGYNCPIARSLCRLFAEQEPFVELYAIRMEEADIPTTAKMRVFIQDFDANRPVSPTRFRVRKP